MTKPAKAIRLADQPATKLDIDSLETSINNLEIKTHDFKKEVNEKFDAVNKRLDGLSQEVGETHRLLEVINSKL